MEHVTMGLFTLIFLGIGFLVGVIIQQDSKVSIIDEINEKIGLWLYKKIKG